jgi:hypothetical protein
VERELLAIALGEVLSRFEGLAHVSVPRRMPDTFIAQVIDTVNEAKGGDPVHAFQVSKTDGQKTLSPEQATALRTRDDGTRSDVLVISREGDFKDLASLEAFRRVNPMSLPVGVAGIEQGEIDIKVLCGAIAQSILPPAGDEGRPAVMPRLEEGLAEVLAYLGEAYRIFGNHDLGWKDAWWLHARFMAGRLPAALEARTTSDTVFSIACNAAAMPVPIANDEFYVKTHGPGQYGRKARDHWQGADGAIVALHEMKKVARNAARLDADTEYPLATMGWESDYDTTVASAEHPVLAMSLHKAAKSGHLAAWRAVYEDEFFDWLDEEIELELRGENEGGEEAELPHIAFLEKKTYILPTTNAKLMVDGKRLDLGEYKLVINQPWGSVEDGDIHLEVTPRRLRITNQKIEKSSGEMTSVLVTLELTVPVSAASRFWKDEPYKLTLTPVPRAGELPFGATAGIDLLVPFPGDEISIFLSVQPANRKKARRRLEKLSPRPYETPDGADVMVLTEAREGRDACLKASESKVDVIVVAQGEQVTIDGETKERAPLSAHWPEPGIITGIDVIDGTSIACRDCTVTICLEDDARRPYSPLKAAAMGEPPADDESGGLEEIWRRDPRGLVEQWQAGFYTGKCDCDRSTLGQIVMFTDPDIGFTEIELRSPGGYHVAGDSTFTLGAPAEMHDTVAVETFWRAFDGLGLGEAASRGQGLTSAWPSRLDLRQVLAADVENYLAAYAALVEQASSAYHLRMLCYPFSLIMYSSAEGKATGVMLSALHPLRLAWSWSAQAAASEINNNPDIDVDAVELMRFVEGGAFPAIGPSPFKLQDRLVAQPLDPGYEDLFMAWSYLYESGMVNNNQAQPAHLSGLDFPSATRSGLSSGGVTAAINDYLRVHPYSSDLRLGLYAQSKVHRSRELDRAVVAELDGLLKNRAGQLPGGVQIIDSRNRLGNLPDKREVLARVSSARDALEQDDENKLWKIPFEWKQSDDASLDIRFVEDALVTAHHGAPISERVALAPSGAATSWPVRRTHAWTRRNENTLNQSGFNAALASPPVSPLASFFVALGQIESMGGIWETWCEVPPGVVLTDDKANWIVAGNSYLDPRLLSSAVLSLSGNKKVLWEWRPPFFPRRWKGGTIIAARPYTVIASLTKDFKEQVKLATGEALGDAQDSVVDALFRELGTRGIGIASLLSMGQSQARGAIGFYLGFALVGHWERQAANGHVRMVLPIDAVNPVFETLSRTTNDDRQKADLLLLDLAIEGGAFKATLHPVEIKMHAAKSTPHAFPGTTSKNVKDALQQLASTRRTLSGFIDAVSAQPRPVLINATLSALIETGLYLSITESLDARLGQQLLAAASTGACTFSLGAGILLWFERGGYGDGAKPFMHRKPADDDAHKLFVDSEALHAELVADQRKPIVNAFLALLGSSEKAPSVADTAGETPHVRDEAEPAPQATSQIAGAKDGEERTDGVDMMDGEIEPIEPTPLHPKREARERRRLSEQVLNERLTNIIETLEELGVSTHRPADPVLPFIEGPSSVIFRLKLARGVLATAIARHMDNIHLALELPSHLKLRDYLDQGCVVIDVPKRQEERFFVDAEDLWSHWKRPEGRLSIPIGLDVFGTRVDLDFSASTSPHLLIGGTTGSGKSEALLTILKGFTKFYDPGELRLMLIDPKRVGLAVFKRDTHLEGEIGYSDTDAIELLEKAVYEVERRYEAFAELGVSDLKKYNKTVGTVGRLPWWLVVLDEYADLTTVNQTKAAIEVQLKRLAQKARAAGVHVIIATQKPVADVISTVVRGNLPAQLALQVTNATESRVIIGEKGAESLTGKGDALLSVANQLVRLQCAMVEPDD